MRLKTIHTIKRLSVALALSCAILFSGSFSLAQTSDLNLPTLGNSGANMFSDDQKYDLGRAWLMAFRGQAPTVDDPIIYDYLEHLIYRLAQHSQLQDRRIDIVVVANPTLNAFAVPGGVVGVHNGIFINAKNEAQLGSILAHELAHLSQQHFERGVEARQRSTIPTMAGLLAGIVLAATTGSDAGIAAIAASQAGAIQSQLRFSRQNEQEADRIGMQTMVDAGLDPRQSAAMFEEMQRASRYYGNRAPEFLLTHPLTETRISDAKTRGDRYPAGGSVNSIDYAIVQARVRIYYEENPQSAIKFFRAKINTTQGVELESNHYGLAIALTDAGRYEEARKELTPLLEKRRNNIPYQLADTKLLAASGQAKQAQLRLQQLLKINPTNYPLMQSYAKLLLATNQIQASRDVWLRLSELYPNQPSIWYQLAEVQGLSGNIKAVHTARAEYFLLAGNPDAATRHLNYALKLVEGDYLQTEIIQQKIRDIQAWKQRLNLK
ncbi:Beta-barrel assembly-enhancing protease [Sinobacterium norvegicum]|uniref:Putative beta-barrel assembly-enhancing protease n=1 Tax=Sinobacterium norvegicum TaxID=1641715 RepID=A0ABN8EG04_9GAMM|nr:M48 family metalloprotease [Sinobacterium norvegicum]CAH0991368.1 Beta-barrel assembly-enhancing protease [Sinobacterium norvegicum]